MTVEQLKAYLSDQAEIKELTAKLNTPTAGPEFFDNSVILDYRKGYPQPRSLVGYDAEREKNARLRWTRRRDRLIMRVSEVEAYIDSIQDSRTRRCFTLYYEDGLTERKVARLMHIDRSMVSKIITTHLKNTGIL